MRTLTALLFAASLLPTALPAAEAPKPRTISVSGRGSVDAVPDRVSMTLGLEARDRELAKAKAAADKAWKALRKAIEAQGIKAEDQKASQLSVQPEYDYEQGRQVLRGYAVRRSLQVTLKDVTKYEALLSASLEAGANIVNQDQWDSSKLTELRAQARKLALIAAKEKAEAMAAVLGQKVGKPLSIEEQGQGWSPMAAQANMHMMKVAGGAQEDGNGGSSAPGMIEVSANVGVVFELE